ncbi:MAG: hypothetical protein IJA27_07365 [Lachnospiraceae bacterium]|nr:hypothetical protein [Lachnospiraceae bacterium]
MIKGKAGKWYEDGCIGGFIREDGTINVCVEKNLTHADTDAYSVQVQNGEGYYDGGGNYISYGKE